jgi:hypothetical protein
MEKLVILFFMLPVFSLGQEAYFTFEDQDLTDWYQSSKDHWAIVSENPVYGDYSLQHSYDSEDAGTDWIALFHPPLDQLNSTSTWQFSLRYDFNPSSNNNWAVMLGRDCLPGDNLGIESALILGVNFDGSDDIIKLWKIHNKELSTAINTGFNWEDQITKKQIVDFRITLFKDQVISIEIDTSGKEFVLLGRSELVWDKGINTFCILYRYTSTYDRGLTVDNISIAGKFLVDTEAPSVERVHIPNQNHIEIRFSEMIKASPGSEWCVEGIGCNFFDISLDRNVQLALPANMTPGNHYKLHLEDISDLYGNEAGNVDFIYYYPASADIVINEIMADPYPPVLLPEAEYIELYNRSNETISIEDWYISINGKSWQLPHKVIQPGEYLVLCDTDEASLFESGVPVLAMYPMGAINNSEAEIILQDVSGKLIHAVHYTSQWFEETEKKSGGWSLEMIDPESPCEMRGNWTSSIDSRGGTPGEENSVYSAWSRQSDPELWRVAYTDTGSVMVYFSEPLDSLRSTNTSFFSVDQFAGSPTDIKLFWPVADKMELFFTENFDVGKEYQLSISRDPCDCSRNPIIGSNNNLFRVPQECDSADVIINEIMFEPREDCHEYIELYNRSEKTIEIRDWQLQVGNKTPELLMQEYFPLLPGAYAIITKEINGIDNPDKFRDAQKIIEMPDLQSLSNEGTLIQIFDSEDNIIDQAFYDPVWHHELNADTHGKSLERISSTGSGLNENNWQSASSTSGYQTPGAKNSQAVQSETKNELIVEPQTITPNSDGLDDDLNICYRLDGPDYMSRVLVYDLNGRLRKTIAIGSIPGTEGCYLFDGKGENGTVLSTGYYILFFEAYDQHGKRFREKVSFVIARE